MFLILNFDKKLEFVIGQNFDKLWYLNLKYE